MPGHKAPNMLGCMPTSNMLLLKELPAWAAAGLNCMHCAVSSYTRVCAVLAAVQSWEVCADHIPVQLAL
jgi:hypothetical protein